MQSQTNANKVLCEYDKPKRYISSFEHPVPSQFKVTESDSTSFINSQALRILMAMLPLKTAEIHKINLPEKKLQLLTKIVAVLKKIDGVAAVVLGGSHATGMAAETSDLDIGIYYDPAHPFSIAAIKTAAARFAGDQLFTVTDFYQWGPWVNGGAWIQNTISKIDFLYRNIDQVEATIEQAKNGCWENHYEQQPPYGFSSVFYLAETTCCVPLYDPNGVIKVLKASLGSYPQKLKKTIIQDSLWSVEFTLPQAKQFAAQKDIYNLCGCLSRSVKNIVHALFAINEQYPISDKRAVDILERSAICPTQLRSQIKSTLIINKKTEKNVTTLEALFKETVSLANGEYQPLYQLGNL